MTTYRRLTADVDGWHRRMTSKLERYKSKPRLRLTILYDTFSTRTSHLLEKNTQGPVGQRRCALASYYNSLIHVTKSCSRSAQFWHQSLIFVEFLTNGLMDGERPYYYYYYFYYLFNRRSRRISRPPSRCPILNKEIKGWSETHS